MNKCIDIAMDIDADNWIFGDIIKDIKNYPNKLFRYNYSRWYVAACADDITKDTWDIDHEQDFEEDNIGFFNISHIAIKNIITVFSLKLNEED